ncbi:hypothetical protein TRICHSKD4_4627 [Roseibium sp. TrichSKD4]|nr:hypothetical protein TRICHSKD4_4627 [Roseibium sp. TrichSKD4]
MGHLMDDIIQALVNKYIDDFKEISRSFTEKSSQKRLTFGKRQK